MIPARPKKDLQTSHDNRAGGTSEPAHVGGFGGKAFDGQVEAGRLHVFMPFGDVNHFRDAFFAGGSERFRVTVLGVCGKTVVVYVDSADLPPGDFSGFLTQANRLLQSLRFP